MTKQQENLLTLYQMPKYLTEKNLIVSYHDLVLNYVFGLWKYWKSEFKTPGLRFLWSTVDIQKKSWQVDYRIVSKRKKVKKVDLD